ncbi:Putative protein [Zobellia galactanivorans]|uniref:Uncharacterized protein n=1 Tax=Zobellia galactanivorans (strain DSM 12802 / CCUG 47099 / CIP 106680 / NCIMB 13871 / Dsij) TaxID=63186 RepID=G0L579_ZOBGA|nr:Putative protein [Zobellia galactanivorans]
MILIIFLQNVGKGPILIKWMYFWGKFVECNL